jgi:hypothetical protein
MNEEKIVEDLILNGALEVSGIDMDTGEMLYSFTEVLKDLDPELYSKINNFFYAEVMNLWEKGFLDISFLEDKPMVTITDKALDEESVKFLNKQSKASLKEIKRLTNES